MTSTFEKYGNDFQIKTLYHMITDEKYGNRIIDIVKPEYFTNEFLKSVVHELLQYYKQYRKIPSLETLNFIGKTCDGNSEQVLMGLSLLEGVTDSDKCFVVDRSTDFFKQQAMVNAIRESIGLIEVEEYDKIFTIVSAALHAGVDVDLGHDYSDDTFDRVSSKRYPISTGFPLLDNEIAGGLGSGETGLILGSTGLGKSMMLVFMAAHAAKLGLNVLYYTMELSELVVGLRMDTKMTGIPLTALLTDVDGTHRERVDKKLKQLAASIGKPVQVKIKYFPTKSATVSTLRSHIKLLRQRGFVPDIIFVDYLDLLKSATTYSEKRFNLEDISEELRGLAGECSVPLWTATQNGRAGIDTNVVGLSAIAEAYAKAWSVDVAIGIGRDAALQEEDKACYYLSKNRLGKTGVILVGDFITSTLDFSMDTLGLDEGIQRKKTEIVERAQISSAVSKLFDKEKK